MIAAVYTQGGELTTGEVPMPIIGEDELLLRVEATSICGTDIKIARRGHRKLQAGQAVILGHEFVGTIEKAGTRVESYMEGQRIGVAPNIGCGDCDMCRRGLMNMCPDYSAFGININGSHTSFVRIPAPAIAQGNIIPLNNGTSAVEASLAEPLSCAINGVRVARVEQGDTVLIYGAGPMGLLNLMVALLAGAAQVYVVDLHEARLEKARALGATKTFNPNNGSVKSWVMDETRGRGLNVVITAVSVAQIQMDAIHLLAPFGRLCLFAGLAAGESPLPLDTNTIHYKNLIVTGMTGGSPKDYQTALRLIEAHRIDVTQVISHILPVDEISQAYKIASSGQGMKVVLATENAVPDGLRSKTSANGMAVN
jgi:threonine dehydrogenase-like Zn-dependent dehydrogenase